MDTESKSGACPAYEAFLEDYLTGELGGSDAAKTSEHLKSCTACREALDLALGSSRLLRVAEPAGDPGPGFSRNAMARIRAELASAAGERSIWNPFVTLAWRFAATATLALAVLLTYDAGWHSQPQPNLASIARQSESREIFSDPASPPENRDDVLMMVVGPSHGKH